MLGDGNPNSGTKGSYFRYELTVIQLLQLITQASNGGNATAGNQVVEIGLLNQILAASLQGKEFEQNLVIDTGDPACPNCATYLQVRVWDPQTQTFGPPRFFDAAGVEFFLGGNPLYGPMELVNPQFVLTNMLAQLTSINSNTTGLNLELTQLIVKNLLTTIDADTSNLDVLLSTRATEASLLNVAVEIVNLIGEVHLGTLDLDDINNKLNSLGQKTMAGSMPVVIASDQTAISVTDNGGSLTVDGLVTAIPANDIVSIVNSSTTLLGSSGVFTGVGEDTLGLKAVTINVFSDKASATDGLAIEWSSDNINYDHIENYTISAGVGFSIQASPRARYFRIVYTNANSAQTSFRLQSILRNSEPTPRKTRLGETPDLEDPGALVQAVIVGKTTAGGGSLVGVKVSPSGSIQVGGNVNATLDAETTKVIGAVNQGTSPWVVSGVVSTGGLTDAELRASPVPVTTTPSGTQNVDITANSIGLATAVKQDNLLAELQLKADLTETQPVSVASLPLPTGAATEATLSTLNGKIPSGLTVTASRLQVELPPGGTGLTDAELRATPVPVSLTSTTITGTVAVSAASLPLPTGAATEATLAAINTKTPALGQAVMALSQPVVIASDQSAIPVTGTFFQATQPVSIAASVAVTGPLTDAQLRATPVPVSLTSTTITGSVAVTGPLTDAQLRATPVPVSGTVTAAEDKNYGVVGAATLRTAAQIGNSTGAADFNAGATGAQTLRVTANAGTNLNTSALSLETTQSAINTKTPALGQATMANSTPVVIASNQSTIPVSFAAASVLFKGRSSTFRTAGRAGVVGQKILSLHNATGSPVVVKVNKIFIDLFQTVIKAVTVAPPIIRAWKVTVLPTNGSPLTKIKIGGSSTSNAAITVLGDASADGTGSGTTLTATLPAGTFVSQECAPRLITAAGYEMADRLEFFGGDDTIELQALEGLVLFLDYTAATQNPTTDMWIAGIEWTEV